MNAFLSLWKKMSEKAAKHTAHTFKAFWWVADLGLALGGAARSLNPKLGRVSEVSNSLRVCGDTYCAV